MKISNKELTFFRNIALAFGDIDPIYINPDDGYVDDLPDQIIEVLNDNNLRYEVAAGATKLAIVLKDYNFVFKIPFAGTYTAVDRCMRCICSCNECPYESLTVYDEDETEDFEHGNYCETEVVYFDLAEEEGVSDYFAETINLTNYDEDDEKVNVYLQEKCIPCSAFNYPDYSKKVERQVSHLSSRRRSSRKWKRNSVFYLNKNWLALLITKVGYKAVIALAEKSKTLANLFEDLHDDNYGIRISDGMPVIFDYSGFDEN